MMQTWGATVHPSPSTVTAFGNPPAPWKFGTLSIWHATVGSVAWPVISFRNNASPSALTKRTSYKAVKHAVFCSCGISWIHHFEVLCRCVPAHEQPAVSSPSAPDKDAHTKPPDTVDASARLPLQLKLTGCSCMCLNDGSDRLCRTTGPGLVTGYSRQPGHCNQ